MRALIGTKIKDYRLKMNISQKDLCGEFLNRSMLSKIENNKMLPSIPQLEYIADKLNVRMAYFFIDEDHTEFIEKNSLYPLDKIGEMFQKEDYYGIVKLIEFEHISLNKDNIIICYFIGMSFFKLDISKDAIKFLKKYANIFMKSKEKIQKEQVINFAIASNTLFKIALKAKKVEEYKPYLLSAKKYLYLYKKTDSFINFVVNSHLAFVYNEMNNYEKTIELLEFFLNSNKTLVYMDIIPDLHLSLNIAYYNIGQYEKSLEHIKKSIFFYSYIGNKSQEKKCYLNYTNALRYNKDYQNAFEIIDNCITNYGNDKFLNQLIIQKSILYFNIGDYNLCLDTFKTQKVSELTCQSKNNYYFMKGHIEFLHKNYDYALKYLLKCEKYFIDEHYYRDLIYIYEDLYTITEDEKFKNKALENKNLTGRRNIY